MGVAISKTGAKIRPEVKTFVVLRMHRSATSLVAEGLERAGVCMGENHRNKIHWEDMRFMRLNDRILKAAGGCWHDPPFPKNIDMVRDQFDHEIAELVADENRKAKRGKYYLWGWKDPRTVFTIRLFTPHLVNPHFIPVFRDPLDVAKSLQRRNGFSIERGYDLAQTYNYRIIKFLEGWYHGEGCTGRRSYGDC